MSAPASAARCSCRVTHYKALPMAGMVVAIGSVILLALWADRLTLVSFQVLLFLIGVGFGPTPSMASVAVQNVVERHQSRHRLRHHEFLAQPVQHHHDRDPRRAGAGGDLRARTPGAGGELRGALPPGSAEAAEAFRRAFFAVAACLCISFVAVVMIEQRPLRTDLPDRKA